MILFTVAGALPLSVSFRLDQRDLLVAEGGPVHRVQCESTYRSDVLKNALAWCDDRSPSRSRDRSRRDWIDVRRVDALDGLNWLRL